MNLAIMQPYFFPYVGYFQLLNAVDGFVFYDDVSFRKQGFINRNRILLQGEPRFFTVPLRHQSSWAPINQTWPSGSFDSWRRKFLRSLAHAYARAPGLRPTLELVEEVLDGDPPNIASLAQRSVQVCARYLGLTPAFATSSESFPTTDHRGQDRVVDICVRAGASRYINLPGGRDLYEHAAFERRGVRLGFLRPQLEPYTQDAARFVPALSIIDVLMSQSQSAARVAVRLGELE